MIPEYTTENLREAANKAVQYLQLAVSLRPNWLMTPRLRKKLTEVKIVIEALKYISQTYEAPTELHPDQE